MYVYILKQKHIYIFNKYIKKNIYFIETCVYIYKGRNNIYICLTETYDIYIVYIYIIKKKKIKQNIPNI